MQYGRVMTRLHLALAASVLSALLFTSCGGTETASSPTAPTTTTSVSSSTTSTTSATVSGCATTVRDLPSSAPSSSGRYTFTVVAASGCAWTARPDAAWADVAPSSGQGNGTATLTIDENTRRDARTVNVLVGGRGFPVVQNAVGCSYTLSQTSFDQSPAGGGLQLRLTVAPLDCAWTATASESWVTVRTGSGTGTATLDFELAANTGDVRHAYLTIAGQRVNITQQGR
jgi:hypothetical protein